MTDYTNTLCLDQFFEGNPDTVPLAQTMAEEINTIRRVTTATAIATELNDCCEELKALLNELLKLIPSFFARQRFFISTKFRLFTNDLRVLLTNVVDILRNHINTSEDRIKGKIESESGEVKREIKINLDKAAFKLIFALTAAIAPLVAEFSALVETLLSTQMGFILTGIGGLGVTIGHSFGRSKSRPVDCKVSKEHRRGVTYKLQKKPGGSIQQVQRESNFRDL